jgi:hypothetical protein
VDHNPPDAHMLDLLDRLRDADATVDEVTLADGTTRLLITVPLLDVLESGADGEAA